MSTSTVTELLARVHKHGAELVPAPVEYLVQIHPPASLPDDLLAELIRNKPAVMAYLRQCSYFRFRLRGGAGGIFRTETRCLVCAWDELVKVYGDLVIVAAHERREV